MTRGVCPKCGKPGSLHLRMVRNKVGRSYPYYYFSHYYHLWGGKKWHYIGRLEKVRRTFIVQTIGPSNAPVILETPKRFKCLTCGRWRFKTWHGICLHMKTHGVTREEGVRARVTEIR